MNTRRVSFLIAVLALSGASHGQCLPLTTTFAGGNGSYGNMFDVVNQSSLSLIVDSVDVHLLTGTWDMQVYYLSAGGGYSGHETTSADWTLAGTATGVVSLGGGVGTPIPINIAAPMAPGATLGFYVTCTNGAGIRYTNGSSVGAVFAQDNNIQILEGSGLGSLFGNTTVPRVVNASLHYSASLSLWQANQTSAWLDLSGVIAGGCSPAVTTRCVNQAVTLNASSNIAGAFGEIAISYAPVVSAAHPGALTLSDGQIVNLDTTQSLLFFNSLGPVPSFAPLSGLNTSFSIGIGFTLSMQGFWLDASRASGLACSQATQLDVVPPSGGSIAGPSGDDETLPFGIASAPQCWAPTGINFFGLNYSTLYVGSNGRILFGDADTDFSPSVSEALGDAPFVGLWTDLNPSAAGTVTLSTPAAGSGIVRVDWQGVPFWGQSATATFGVEFDSNTNDVTIDNLSLMQENPTMTSSGDAQFLGLSSGVLAGATDGGTTDFSSGTGTGSGSDMLYDFLASGSANGLVPSLLPLPSSFDRIIFSPVGGTYTWVSF